MRPPVGLRRLSRGISLRIELKTGHAAKGLGIASEQEIALSANDRRPVAANRRGSLWLLIGLSVIYFLMEFVPNVLDGYGYFIDELYYIACSKRLAFGYVDHPPLSILVLTVWSSLFGTSIAAIRFLPAFFGAATVFMTGWIARRLGAGLFGQGLAALAYMAAAVPMVIFGIYFAGLQNSYHLWGLPDDPIDTVISLGIGPESLSPLLESVVEAGIHDCDYCMGWRDEMTIYIAHGPKIDFHEVWEDFGHFE